MNEPPRDFYFSMNEAREAYFSVAVDHGCIVLYRTEDGTEIWATEVVNHGQEPVSLSGDLVCVAKNVRAEYAGRKAAIRPPKPAPPLQILRHRGGA